MSFTYEDILRLSLPSDDSESHGNELRANWAAVSAANAPESVYYVSPSFTTAALGNSSASDRRHFPTIQEAITAAQTETVWWDAWPVIIVYPGNYGENLSITGSITIVGAIPSFREGLGGGFSTKITGVTSAASPLVTITPPGDAAIQTNFMNLSFRNGYNANNATEISTAYLLKMSEPATFSQPALVGFKGCDIEAQCAGLHNTWESLINAEGWGQVVIRDTILKMANYCGGSYDGGIRTAIKLRGDSASNPMAFGGSGLNFTQWFAGSGSPFVFDFDNYALGEVGRSQFPPESRIGLFNQGATGDNILNGAMGTTVAEYGNLVGVDLSWY